MDKLLISTKNYVAYYDGKNLRRVVEGAFFFYGLSQYEPTGDVLVARTSGEGMKRRTIIERLDRRLNSKGSFVRYPDLVDVHQILCWAGKVWICATWHDAVDCFDGNGTRLSRWRPFPSTNKLHINSINAVGDLLYICAHNTTRRPGEVYVLTPDFEMKGVFEVGNDIHNVGRLDDSLCVLSSLESKVYLVGLGYTELAPASSDGYLRGLAISPTLTYIGVSKFADRTARKFGDAQLDVYDRKWKRVRTIPLPGAGQVYEVRLVGTPDAAHAGKTISLEL